MKENEKCFPPFLLSTLYFLLFSLLTRLARLLHQHRHRRKSDQDVNNLYEHWPCAKENFNKVPVEKTNKSPVKSTNE